MTKTVRTLTATDKALVALALRNAGVKARVRVFPGSLRIVFDGAWQAVAEALNAEGYLHATGDAFGRHSFEGNQVFVRYAR